MGYYLHDNPPKRSQYRQRRREKLSGRIVVHTAENTLDLAGIDSGAENVARFIARRTDAAGSYHRIHDRDSTVKMLPLSSEAFHDVNSNRHSVGVSFALKASEWLGLNNNDKLAYLTQGAKAAAEVAIEIEAETGITVPAVRISRNDPNKRSPGFIAHGDSDPKRRSDPGPNFPWATYLELFEEERARMEGPVPPKTHPDGGKGGPIVRLWLDELDAITYAVTGQAMTEADSLSWINDLVNRVYVKGENDLSGVARWWHWKLTTEGG